MTADRPFRCAQLVETLGVGGAENLAVRIANGLAAAGHESHLIVLGGAGPLARFVEPAVALHAFEFSRESITRPWSFAASLRRGHALLHGTVHRHGLEIVQTHLPGANFWGLEMTLWRRTAVVATIHNNQEFRYGDADRAWRAALRRFAYGRIVRQCAATVAVSDKVKASLARDLHLDGRARARISVVRNGVPVPPPATERERAEARTGFDLAPGEFMVLAAGRHCEQKNFKDLVGALEVLGETGRPLRVVVAGEGPLMADLEARIESASLRDRISLLGPVMDMPKLFLAADAFILPSLWEGLPLVMLEAMAAGLPVLGNRIPGVVEVVEDGRHGFLAEPGDPRSLADGLSRLLAAPHETRAMGRAGRELVVQSFGFDRVTTELERVYRKARSRL